MSLNPSWLTVNFALSDPQILPLRNGDNYGIYLRAECHPCAFPDPLLTFPLPAQRDGLHTLWFLVGFGQQKAPARVWRVGGERWGS